MSYQNTPQHPQGHGNYQTIPQSHSSVYIGNPERSLFSTKEIRSKFLTKVFSILFVQLLCATALIAWFTLHEPTKAYLDDYGAYYLYASFAVGLVVFLALSCIDSARRSFPMNFVLLSILTLAYGLIAAILSSRFQTVTVLSAFGATAFATLAIILLAKFSPFDLTACGCGLCILALLHMLMTIVLMLVLVPKYTSIGYMIIAGSGAFLVSLYMIYDLQLIMGGRSVELSPEEYILGAALIYIDILQLFQYMLILFSNRQ